MDNSTDSFVSSNTSLATTASPTTFSGAAEANQLSDVAESSGDGLTVWIAVGLVAVVVLGYLAGVVFWLYRAKQRRIQSKGDNAQSPATESESMPRDSHSSASPERIHIPSNAITIGTSLNSVPELHPERFTSPGKSNSRPPASVPLSKRRETLSRVETYSISHKHMIYFQHDPAANGLQDSTLGISSIETDHIRDFHTNEDSLSGKSVPPPYAD